MKLVKELKWEALFKGILYVVLGGTALIVSERMVKVLGYSIGVLLIVAGAVSMISYLLRDARQNYYHDDFAYGLLGIVLGWLVLYKVEFIISLVPFLLGLLVLISGIVKLQDVIDMKRLECGNWIGMLVLAVLNLVLGIVLIRNPFDAAVTLFKVLGVGLIASGVTDMVVSIYFAGMVAKYKKQEEKEKEQEEKERAGKVKDEIQKPSAGESGKAEAETIPAIGMKVSDTGTGKVEDADTGMAEKEAARTEPEETEGSDPEKGL